MRPRPLLLTLSILPLALFGVAAAPADGDPTVSIDALEAQVDAETVDVSGAVSWSGAVPVLSDPEGDAAVPGIGTDMIAGTITKELGSTTMTFDIEVADAMPEIHAPPETIQFGMPLEIGDSVVDLQAWRTAQYQNPRSTDPVFSVNTCSPDPDTGQNTCTTTDVDGEFADGHVTWFVPQSLLTAGPGDQIFITGSAWADIGASGLVWYTGGPFAMDLMSAIDVFHMPGEVDLSLVDDGGDSVASAATTVDPDGAFARTLDTSGLASGDYTLVATTCYGGIGQCVSESRPVTIP